MNLAIRNVVDKGDLENERLVLRVTSDADLGDYVLLVTGFYDDSVTTGVRNAMWFPYKKLSKGDLVVIYTKPGKEKERVSKNGSKSHFYYMDLHQTIWDQDGIAAVVLYAPQWEGMGSNEL